VKATETGPNVVSVLSGLSSCKQLVSPRQTTHPTYDRQAITSGIESALSRARLPGAEMIFLFCRKQEAVSQPLYALNSPLM